MSQKFQEHYARSDDARALAFKNSGICHVNALAVWDFIEFSTLGSLTRLFSANLPQAVQVQIANNFGFSHVSFFLSVLKLILKARNTATAQNCIGMPDIRG